MALSLRCHRVRSLLVAGLVAESVYLAAAVRLPWWRYGGRLNSWRRILGGGAAKSGSGWDWTLVACVLGILILMAAYLWGWRAVRTRPVSRWIIWAGAVLFALTLFWLLPATSDLFGYLSQAHLFTDLGANPLAEATIGWHGDALLQAYQTRYAARPSAYGPAWVLLSSLGTAGKYDVVVGLFYLKGLALVAYLGCAWLVQQITVEVRPDSALEATYLFAWNPLVLLMAVGGGHNDIVMMAAVMTAAWFLLRRQWGLAFGALALSVWTKYVSAAFIPLFGLYAAQAAIVWGTAGDTETAREPGWLQALGERLRSVHGRHSRLMKATERKLGGVSGGLRKVLLRSTASLVGVTALVVLPFGQPDWMGGALWRLVRPANWQRATPEQATWILIPGLLLFAVAYVLLVVRYAVATHVVHRPGQVGKSVGLRLSEEGAQRSVLLPEVADDPSGKCRFQRLMDTSFAIVLLAFVLGAARSQPWHLIWPAALAGLTSRRWAWPAIIGLSTVMLCAQVWVEWGAPGLGD